MVVDLFVADVLYGSREGLFQFNNVATITTRTADGVVSVIDHIGERMVVR